MIAIKNDWRIYDITWPRDAEPKTLRALFRLTRQGYEADITADKICFPAFNATIQAIPCDAGSAAGSNSCCSGFDELWAYTSEAARRLWDEMTPPPTRRIACRVTVTYAGYEAESILLEELYRRGLQQPLIGEDLYAGDGLLMFWSHKPIAP